MSHRVIVRMAVLSAGLVFGVGAASAYASTGGPRAAASVARHHRPPKLRAGEEWSYVEWYFGSKLGHCDRVFGGDPGTQTCDGDYGTANYPKPEFGGWGFLGKHDGTSRATAYRGQDDMHVYFYTPGAEILGTIPSERSDRYTVTSSQGPGGWRIESPFNAPDYAKTPAGDKGGPLHINVHGGASIFHEFSYTFAVHGWVVVVRHAKTR